MTAKTLAVSTVVPALLVMATAHAAWAQLGTGWIADAPTKKIHLDDDTGLHSYSWTSSKSVCSPACADYHYDSATDTETFRLFDNRSNRSEIRLQNDYSSGRRQFQGYVRFDAPLDDESLFQIWGSTSGATQLMIRGYSSSGGSLRGGGTTLASNIYGVEQRVNVIHDQGNTIQIYVNGSLKRQFVDDEAVTNYHKYGCYGTLRTGPVTVKWRKARSFRDGWSPPTSPWSAQDIGAVAAPGSAGAAGSAFTVRGSGADIWGSADELQFVHRKLAGDGAITARVASLDATHEWAKAGVMIRESLAPGAKHAFVLVSAAKGLAFQRRISTGGSSASTSGGAGAAPRWLRLTRASSTVTAFASSDGTSWTKIGSASISMATDVYIGLAVTSHVDGTLATAQFDHVATSGGAAALDDAAEAAAAAGGPGDDDDDAALDDDPDEELELDDESVDPEDASAGCATAGSGAPGSGLLLAAATALLLRRRRRRGA